MADLVHTHTHVPWSHGFNDMPLASPLPIHQRNNAVNPAIVVSFLTAHEALHRASMTTSKPPSALVVSFFTAHEDLHRAMMTTSTLSAPRMSNAPGRQKATPVHVPKTNSQGKERAVHQPPSTRVGVEYPDEVPRTALMLLGRKDAVQVAMERSDTVAHYVALMRGGGTDLKDTAIVALIHLACTEYDVAIAEAGVIPLAVTLLHGGCDESCKMATIRLMMALANASHTYAIVQAGTIAPVVALLQADGSDTLKRAAIDLLSTLAWHNRADAIVQAGAIAPLVNLAHTGGTDALRECAILAVHAVAGAGPLHMFHAVQAGYIVALVAILRTSGHDSLQETATHLLQDIFYRGYANAVLDAGAMHILAATLNGDGTDAIKKTATELLSILTATRARRNWAAVRELVHVKPYVIFWHAHVGQLLCAPGGKWAKRDLAAFEDEF